MPLIRKIILAIILVPVALVASIILLPKLFPLTPEESAAAGADIYRSNKTIEIGSAVKKSLLNPDSLKWDIIYANTKATVICMRYTAKTGLGRISTDQAIFSNGNITHDNETWAKECSAPDFFNMDFLKNVI